MKTFDLGWGESVAIRSAFLDAVDPFEFRFGYPELLKMGYTKHEGNEELIELTKKVIHRQTGIYYNHILITNGATGAVTIALRSYEAMGSTIAITRKAPYFPVYPAMVKAAGLIHSTNYDMPYAHPEVYLIDSPSNPNGRFDFGKIENCIWDAAYYSKAYFLTPGLVPKHTVMAGSYSKLTGINGIRVGWIATNDFFLYGRAKGLVTAEYCGLSASTTTILINLLKQVDWPKFERLGRKNLDANREEWSNLEKYFGVEVSNVGMFYYAPIDKTCRKLLEKSNVVWTPGSNLGTDDSFGRFNIGQDCKLVREAVKIIKKNDRI